MTNTSVKVETLQSVLSAIKHLPIEDRQDALFIVAMNLIHKAILQGNLDYVLGDFNNLTLREGQALLRRFDKRAEDDSIVAY